MCTLCLQEWFPLPEVTWGGRSWKTWHWLSPIKLLLSQSVAPTMAVSKKLGKPPTTIRSRPDCDVTRVDQKIQTMQRDQCWALPREPGRNLLWSDDSLTVERIWFGCQNHGKKNHMVHIWYSKLMYNIKLLEKHIWRMWLLTVTGRNWWFHIAS